MPNTAEIKSLLQSKYSPPSYAFVHEVPNGTSNNKSRTCDALAMGCWKSRGVHLHGFEIKASRGDWRRELQKREKSAVFEQYCHFWWIVAPPKVVKPEELPASWGLMIAKGNGLSVESAAELRSPDPIPFDFLASIMRRMQQSYTEDERRQIRHQEFRRGVEEGKRSAKSPDARWESMFHGLQKSVRDFEEASGIRIDSYNGKNVGESFAAYNRLMCPMTRGKLKNAIDAGNKLAADAETVLNSVGEID